MSADTSGFFFILCIASTIGYALQATLMTKYYRSMDSLSAVSYRGLSLAVSMAPLLFFVPRETYSHIPAVVLPLLAASTAAVFANWSSAKAFRFLPVGIASAASMSFATVSSVAIGIFFLGESISSLQALLLILILGSVLALGATRNKGSVPAEFNVPRGMFAALLFGFFIGIGYTLVGVASRQSHPLLVAYLWESFIGVLAFLIVVFRGVFRSKSRASISGQEFLGLALASSPTAVGTGCYAYAVSIGPVGIATAVLGTMMVFTTLLAILIYKERLSSLAWLILFLVCVLLALLRLSLA